MVSEWAEFYFNKNLYKCDIFVEQWQQQQQQQQPKFHLNTSLRSYADTKCFRLVCE